MSEFSNEPYEKVEMNSFQKVIGVIFSPVKAFYGIKNKPTIILPMLIFIILSVIFSLMYWDTQKVALIQQLEMTYAAQGVEPTEAVVNQGLAVARIGMLVSAIFGSLISALITGLYYYVCSKLAKTTVGFKSILSIVFHVNIISAISIIIYIILMLTGTTLNVQEPITSLAVFLPASMKGTVAYALVLPFEVFNIWGLIVTYIGLKTVTGMSKKAALIAVVAAFIFSLLMASGSIIIANSMTPMV